VSPAEIIHECQRAGLTLRLVSGGIGIRPRDQLTPELAEAIRAHKPALLAALRHPMADLSPDDAEAVHEHLEERSAIQEFDGGLSRPEAEREARRSLRVFLYRLTDDPDAELVFIGPGRSLESARERLQQHFGAERVIEVRERQA